MSLFLEFVFILIDLVLQRLPVVLKSDYHDGYIVQGSLVHRGLQDSLNRLPTVLVDHLAPVLELGFGGFPSCLNYLDILKFVEDPIATKHDKVVIVLNFKALDVRSCYHHFWIPSVLEPFSLYVTEGPGH